MTIQVGEVIAVNGVKVIIRVFEESSKETLFHNGEIFKGVSIREFITIRRGFKDIVCIIEGEYLDENKFEEDGNRIKYIRKIEAKPIGYFDGGQFKDGIKFLPMIKDQAFLLQEEKIASLYGKAGESGFVIGKTLKEEISISLPWHKLFNTHIGIFGNTGSGKSNTLAKLYTVLFDQKKDLIGGRSKFVVLDFNGEYTSGQLVQPDYKNTLSLNTSSDNGDKFTLVSDDFWNSDTLSILFQATANTQRPFLNRVISGKQRYAANQGSTLAYIRKTFEAVFTAASPKADMLDLMRNIAKLIGDDALKNTLNNISWHSRAAAFCMSPNIYFNADGAAYNQTLKNLVDAIAINQIDDFDELVLRANLQLTRDLIRSHVQFEHIQPLLKRIDASLFSLRRVVRVDDHPEQIRMVTVISLKKCNQEIKKVLPLLIAKHYYYAHKNSVGNPPDKTMHLIIDEAHNILSQQSSRESESWKDYRLELFEEIIKEGRKFGMYITLSSQRPADISPTIISQIHNFFIHRLVNERDLFLLENTISTLDNLSRSLIPNLAKGSCIVTGTSFDLPMVLQVEPLDQEKQPDSEDVDLKSLWSIQSDGAQPGE